MPPSPTTLDAFERMFPDDAACVDWLIAARWPNGFFCPRCGAGGKRLRYRPTVHQCEACGYDVSVTAGTLMHKSRLPLRTWFRAAWLVATHKNGISGRQLQALHVWDDAALELPEEPAVARLQLVRGQMRELGAVAACGEVLHVDEQQGRLGGHQRHLPAEGGLRHVAYTPG